MMTPMPEDLEQGAMTAGPDHAVAPSRARIRHVTGFLAVLLPVVLVGLLLAVLLLPSFARPSWVEPGVVGLSVAWVADVMLFRQTSGHLKRAGRTESYFSQFPRLGLLSVWSLLLIGAVALIDLPGQEVVAARLLGPTPAHATLISAKEGPYCRHYCPRHRQTRPVVATFDAGGSTVTASLVASGGYDRTEDQAGEPLVYDPRHPQRVMRASDWAAGRSQLDAVLLLVGLVLLLPVLVVPVPVMLRRRRRFGTLKPGTAIRSVEFLTSRWFRKYPAWRVRFADGTATRYQNTSRFRSALRARIDEAGMAGLDPFARALLAQA
jgi:hypothetical protein